MLSNRRIPVLQILNRRLVKTISFGKASYIGDPLNAVKIFNDKEVDELIITDITPDRMKTGPDTDFVRTLLSECRMPVGYGGGIRGLWDAEKIIGAGAEKIIVNTLAFEAPNEAHKISSNYGSQALSLSIDYKSGLLAPFHFYKNGGTRKLRANVNTICETVEKIGCGEIILHDIDHDGRFSGLNFALYNQIKDRLKMPIIMCGGARNHDDLNDAFTNGVHSVAAGSMFVYQGPLKAVLIQY